MFLNQTVVLAFRYNLPAGKGSSSSSMLLSQASGKRALLHIEPKDKRSVATEDTLKC